MGKSNIKAHPYPKITNHFSPKLKSNETTSLIKFKTQKFYRNAALDEGMHDRFCEKSTENHT